MAEVTRRNMLQAAAFSALIGSGAMAGASKPAFQLESGKEKIRTYHAYHEGLGSIDVRMFDFGRAARPANFLIYDMPVGSSEGVHIHNLTDPKLGPYDEYYYIIEGRGRMMIAGEPVMVSAGDHVHTPLEIPHGIENIDSKDRLKVFLTYIDRSA